jgi:hypothetical protein
MPNHPYLSDGNVKTVHEGFGGCNVGYVIKLDEKAPNEYAYDTDEVLMFPCDIELVSEAV